MKSDYYINELFVTRLELLKEKQSASDTGNESTINNINKELSDINSRILDESIAYEMDQQMDAMLS